MAEEPDAKPVNPLLWVWMIIRVSAITVAWVGLFLGSMIGYLTIPIVLIGLFLVGYTIFDVIRWRLAR